MRRFLKQVDPKLVIIMETELWPNMINQLYKRKFHWLLQMRDFLSALLLGIKAR